MERPSKSRRRFVFVVVAALAAVCIVKAKDGERLTVESVVHRLVEVPLVHLAGAVDAVTDPIREILRREHLRDRIRELEARVVELELANARLAESDGEGRRLRRLLGLRDRHERSVLAARVIRADSSGPSRAIVIDAGTDAGITADAPVLAAGGLVGRVLKVEARTSVVQLLVDSSAAVAAVDERSRVQGVLFGSGGSDTSLRYVPNLEDVRPGDRLLASGLDGIYPKGVAIGQVLEVAPGPDAFKRVAVAPAVNLQRLETVAVLLGESALPVPDRKLAQALPSPPDSSVNGTGDPEAQP